MRKSLKKILNSVCISVITLAIGFAVTAISFNLFDNLSTNQMKLLFAYDVLCLITVGVIFFFLSESKKAKAKYKRELERRHKSRMSQREQELAELKRMINNSDFAA